MIAGTMEPERTGELAEDSVPAEVHAPVPSGAPCASCTQPLTKQFFVQNGAPVCPGCRAALEGSFCGALLLGLAATLASVGLYYVVFVLSGWRFVFVAVLAGVFIGGAVRKGAHASKLVRHRWLAVLLTYLAVVATYAHTLAEMPGIVNPFDAALRALYLPLLMILGQKNVVTLILLGFGLHEAWKFSAPPYVHVEGPYRTTDG